MFVYCGESHVAAFRSFLPLSIFFTKLCGAVVGQISDFDPSKLLYDYIGPIRGV